MLKWQREEFYPGGTPKKKPARMLHSRYPPEKAVFAPKKPGKLRKKKSHFGRIQAIQAMSPKLGDSEPRETKNGRHIVGF